MASDTITLTLKVKQDGKGFKLVGQNAEKAAKGLEKTSKSARDTDRNLRGAANMSSNTTKNFSKMSQGITGSLVPAYATLAANVFALTAAFGLLSRNDAISKLNEGLEYTGALAGRNLTMVADKLKEITGNAISAEQAMRAVAVGTSAGFSEDQLNSLTRVAKGASLALGRDMSDAMDRLIRGAAKLEPEILDELGIMVRLDDATQKYADSINKTASELTQFERRMAFTNAIIADGEKKFQAIQAALDPSEFGQLSATFSDLTKSIVEVINTAFAPLIGFLAQNKLALGAVVAAFGASISKHLVGSIKEHTEAVAENAKVSANQAKSQLQRVKVTGSMTKHMKSLAKAEGMSEKQLKRLQRLSHSQVNLMNKSNPVYKTALKTRRALTLATFDFTLATQKEGVANAIGMLSTHGFTLARAEFILVQEAAAIATAKATIGQDFLTASIIRAKAAMVSASAAAKFYGTALLVALPVIMGVITAVAILGPMLVNLFKKPEDNLSKQLKKNEERLEGFSKVIRIYVESVRMAETETEAWFKTIKPLAGLFSQVSTAIKDTNLEAETKLIIANANARRRLARSIAFENAKREGKLPTFVATGGASISQQQSTSTEEAADAIKNVALEGEDLEAIQTSLIALTGGLIASMDQMKSALESDAKTSELATDALKVLTNARKETVTVLNAISESEDFTLKTSQKHQKEIEKITFKLQKGVEAYENFNEIVTKAQNINQVKTFGLFAKAIDNVTDAVAELDDILLNLSDSAAQQKAQEIVDAYGLIPRVIGQELKKIERTGPLSPGGLIFPGHTYEEVDVLESAVDMVKRFKNELEDVNALAKQLQLDMAATAQLEEVLGENSRLAFTEITENAKTQLKIKKDTLALTKKGGDEELQAKLAVLEAEKEILALTRKRFDFLASQASDSGMGAAASAAIAGQGAVSANEIKRQQEKDRIANAHYEDKEGKDGKVITAEDQRAEDEAASKAEHAAARSAALFAQSKSVLAGVAEDLAKIGPEGAFMSAAIEGAVNLQTAFVTAFEAMADGSASMATKIQAGLGVISSMIGMLAAMSKASSEDKVRAIDQEIEAEKRRDGSSAQSVAKLGALEKKKEAQQRKAFEENKKMKLAQTAIATASGALAAYTSAFEALPPPANAIVGGLMAAAVVAMGAKQMAMISSTSFNGGASASGAPPSIAVGNRSNSVDLARGRSPSGELAYARGERGTGSGMTNYTPAFAGYKMNRASGGYVVGEQGPELFMPEVPGEIIPSGQGAGGVTNVNFSISAVDSRGVEDLLINQRGNIISMIRESANANGELFLENVNTNAMEMN